MRFRVVGITRDRRTQEQRQLAKRLSVERTRIERARREKEAESNCRHFEARCLAEYLEARECALLRRQAS